MKKTVSEPVHRQDPAHAQTILRKDCGHALVRETEAHEPGYHGGSDSAAMARLSRILKQENRESALDPDQPPDLLQRTNLELSVRVDQLLDEIKERERIEKTLRESIQELSFRSRVADTLLKGSDPDIYGEVLQIILEATASPHGIFSYVDQQGAFLKPAVFLKEKKTYQQPTRFQCTAWERNPWTQALLRKQPILRNSECKFPEGHVCVSRAMMVPVVHGGKLIGFFGVADKPTDYTDEDQRRLEAFSAYIAPILDSRLKQDFLEEMRRDAERELAESREQLRALAANLEEVREEERKVIAREIHDEFGQALTCLKMDLSYLSRRMHDDQKDLLEKVNAMIRLINNNIQLIRDVSSQLRPGILDDFGLLSAVEWQLQSFFLRTGIQFRINSNLDGQVIDSRISTALFRIFQEALTNVMRHSEATEVAIELIFSEGVLSMKIQDNGKGISEEDINDRKSLGILGMRERVVLLGGNFQIEGKKGEGTSIQVSIPAPAPP